MLSRTVFLLVIDMLKMFTFVIYVEKTVYVCDKSCCITSTFSKDMDIFQFCSVDIVCVSVVSSYIFVR